ncbi:MAG: hypothetical protein ACLQHK_11050, partial [Gallionellaceae bacterium]
VVAPDETTSHSTRLSKDDSQVAGYSRTSLNMHTQARPTAVSRFKKTAHFGAPFLLRYVLALRLRQGLEIAEGTNPDV